MAINDDSKYIEDQIEAERKHYRLTISLVASTLATVIITLLAYLLILRSRNARLRAENSCSKAMTEKQAFELMYMELSAEHDTLQKKYGDILADIKGKAMDNDSLRGKEIGRYLGLARHYTVSSGIRRKLGLGERDVNIDAYLRQLIDMLHQTRQDGR